ncbi:carbohydrate kinase family protein [Streptomyces sp. G45]|uniref:carbohydrate kinase family protein n=1 Tax=Streptomyces sp. G45 TaxID=3406627 RepID=UPI003C1AEC18
MGAGVRGAADAGATVPDGPGGLLVVGDVVTDIVARHRTPLAPGTDTAAAIRTVPGGAGANVACWAAHWGHADVRFLGRVGADAAQWHRDSLLRSAVRPHLVVDPDAPTGTVISLVDAGGHVETAGGDTDGHEDGIEHPSGTGRDGGGACAAERTFLTDSGASLRLAAADWTPSLLDGVTWLHLSGYLFFAASSRAAARAALEAARSRGVTVSVDPASAGFLVRHGVDRFLAQARDVDVLLPSRDEAELLTGLPRAADAAAALSRRFPDVVVTLGSEGALAARGGQVRVRVPGVRARARDSTGAGDAFSGAFIAARLAGAGVREAVAEGCRAGARAVERVGARPGLGAGIRGGGEGGG